MHSAYSKPLVIRVVGGLGNQMFQYATALALAVRANRSLLIDARVFERYTLHKYGLDAWSVSAPLAQGNITSVPSLLSITLAERFKWFRPKTYYKEPSLAYDPALQGQSGVDYLSGYFQTARYFEDVRAQLTHEFRLSKPLPEAAERLLDELTGVESIAIHVRRGDYVSNPETLRIHGVCSQGYYQAAIDLALERVPNARFFVFSNDHSWVRQHLKLPESTVQVDGLAQHPAQDIALMAACKHHIIANSSFSWWAAWLSSNVEGVKIAPSPWYDDPTYPESDLIPRGWLRVKK